jgi:hypothetical protein
MSKNVNVNGIEYRAVSVVQLNTVDGKTAQFKDVDEIAEPSGSVNITANGSYNVKGFATAVVNVPSDGTGGMESGSFVGNDTNTVDIPVTSKKTHLVIFANMTDAYALNIPYANLEVNAVDGVGYYYSMVNVGGDSALGYAVPISSYKTDDSAGKNRSCVFDANKITVISSAYNKGQKFNSQLTYQWFAW